MVRALFRVRRRVDEIAAELADILEAGALPAHDVVPEIVRGEFLSDHNRATLHQQRAGREQPAGGVVERQAVVHAVARPRIHHAGEGVARQHHAVVVHVGRLRQAGRARGVDVERAILDGQRAPLRGRELVAGQAFDRRVDARQVGRRCIPVQPDLGAAAQMRACTGERPQQVRGDDDVGRGHHVDAVRQRGAGEVGVEEGDHAADAGDADPDRQEFRASRHQQADRVALAHTLGQRPAGIAVGARGQLAIGQALAIGEERRRVAVLVGELADHLREDPGGMPGDRRGHAQGAQGAPEAGHVRGQPLDQSHGEVPARAPPHHPSSASHDR